MEARGEDLRDVRYPPLSCICHIPLSLHLSLDLQLTAIARLTSQQVPEILSLNMVESNRERP